MDKSPPNLSTLYICDECERDCFSRTGLRTHQRTHTLLPLESCPHCDRTFISLNRLYEHIPVHYVDTCGISREELYQQYIEVRNRAPHDLINPPLPTENLPPPPVLPAFPHQVKNYVYFLKSKSSF